MTRQTYVTGDQEYQFNQFLLDGTTKALVALHNIFELNVTSSDSTISIARAIDNKNLKHFGNGPLFIVSSKLADDIKGNCSLIFRWRDFKFLSDVMWPVLNLMFMSKPDLELDSLEGQKPAWMEAGEEGHLGDAGYQEQMMDALKEMGNVLIGLYSKSIFKVCGLNVNHSQPLVMKDAQQTIFQRMFFSETDTETVHLVIENELFLDNGAMKMWCIVSPTSDSFSLILDKLDEQNEDEDDFLAESGQWV